MAMAPTTWRGARQAMTAMASTRDAASHQNKPRQPSVGSNHCTGKVEAIIPSEPAISIQELARSCAAGVNMWR